MNMAEVMNLFDTTGAWTLPVIDNQGKYVGMMSRQHLYETYRALLKQFSED
jgi:CIC family chloride channel protein